MRLGRRERKGRRGYTEKVRKTGEVDDDRKIKIEKRGTKRKMGK